MEINLKVSAYKNNCYFVIKYKKDTVIFKKYD